MKQQINSIPAGRKMRDLRKFLGLSREEFANKLKISVNTLGRIENSQKRLSVALISRIKTIYRITPAYFYDKEHGLVTLYENAFLPEGRTPNERLSIVIQFLKLSQSQMAEILGISQPALSNVLHLKKKFKIEDYTELSRFDINMNWLETGKGKMINDKINTDNTINLDLVDNTIPEIFDKDTEIGPLKKIDSIEFYATHAMNALIMLGRSANTENQDTNMFHEKIAKSAFLYGEAMFNEFEKMYHRQFQPKSK